MSNEEIICPHCGSETPNFNFCSNCGNPLKDLEKGSQLKDIEDGNPLESSVDSEEIIIAALTTSDTSKSRFGGGKTKHLFFTTNYLLEDEGSNIGFLGNTMSMEQGGDLIQEGINEKIDIKQIQQERPNLKVIPYTEIEKAQFEITRFVVNLEIKAPSFTPKYVLGAKKYGDQFQDKIRSLLEPKIGDRFIVK